MKSIKICMAAVILLSGCSTLAPDGQRRVVAQSLVDDPRKPVEIDSASYSQQDLALIEITAPDFGAWITTIDGIPVATFNEIAPDTVFLKPGNHKFTVAFRNIRGLIVRGAVTDVVVELKVGHTYMPHNAGFDTGTLSESSVMKFGVADYGNNFPRDCLTGQITRKESAYAVSFAVRQSLYKKCITLHNYVDKYTYVPPEAYQ